MVCWLSLTSKTEIPREMQKVYHSSSRKKFCPTKMRLSSFKPTKNSYRLRVKHRKTLVWKLIFSLMSNLSRAPSPKRRTSSSPKSKEPRTRNSLYSDRSKKAKTLRKLSAESSWTNSKRRLRRSAISIQRPCSRTPRSSRRARLRKNASIKLISMLLKCLRETTRMRSCSKKSSTKRRWNTSRHKSTNKKKTIKS